MSTEQLMQAEQLVQTYTVRQGPFHSASLRAVQGVSFTLDAGQTLAVVGESGCGKSTLARMLTLIEQPTSGTLSLCGRDATHPDRAQLRTLRREVQMVFQNPYGSLNPRKTISTILEEPLVINTRLARAERRRQAREMMERVGLRPDLADRYPHMFSGGQRQRIAVARALMLRPRVMVLDEPVSALDVSVQAQVLNLLNDLQDEFGLAYLFISHDLSVVRHVADRIMVMYLGRPVEIGSRDAVFKSPRHPYTRALLSATPSVDPDARHQRVALSGELPSPLDPPPGCAFHRRCPWATDHCRQQEPPLRDVEGVDVACHHAERIMAEDRVGV
ncbi:ABC transporter ATP-binding protein [Kushneria phosphatilytica]|uniref:Dipeptide ABC transporter ATP-binding protein n=1 Tax=Kushneria phosphatilytica TaxID=657387 RepID=A0A1S1P140_9GAMM|nr:dipeptide ABC transporter ATP-binding protein [Kushneria phosphatilytica]OHV12195.1 dipeptide ABC transporter ATP-binding protein [Kushneria phosphatilytica]QEL11387.1 dipeptide ABC transporter ATP-binding protein [Kushneria phosphatilytica]